MDYAIWISKERIPVSEAVYKAYWQGVRKERYFVEGDIHNHTFSYNALDTEEMNGCDIFSNSNDIPVEDQVIRSLDMKRLESALEQLSREERTLILRLYYYDESLRNISRSSGVPLTTLHYRHRKILSKLKTYMTE